MSKGCIYIMTNKGIPGMVKLGYAEDVEARRKQLSTTGVPFEYDVYATYHTKGRLEDKKLHQLIDALNPELRVNKNREFFSMSPEEAYKLLQAIALISGTENELRLYSDTNDDGSEIDAFDDKKEDSNKNSGIEIDKLIPEKETRVKKRVRPALNFLKCGIPVGSVLEFKNNPNITVRVADEKRVFYHGERVSLSKLARELMGLKYPVQGTGYFTYNGEPLLDIVERKQWKNFD